MKIISINLFLVFLSLNIFANDAIKATIKSNGTLLYFQEQAIVDAFSSMFSEGTLYGRLRSNNFYFRYNEDSDLKQTHMLNGIGASLVYNSARYKKFDILLGAYLSQAVFTRSRDAIGQAKSGKDLLSRYNYANNGATHMAVLGQANIRYQGIDKTEIIIGRQLLESFYAKSNDTKMAPNTFDGIVFNTELIANTTLSLAYLYQQKLRDHTSAHSVLMYGDSKSDSGTNPEWSANDDSAMHKGLTYTALKAAGKPTDSPLLLLDYENISIENLEIDTAFYNVPQLLSQAMIEFKYTFNLSGLTLSPGLRYINQFDLGAGEVGGASYTGDTVGYKNPRSLDAQMLGARLVAQIDAYKINLGYTNILDNADLITPWRGFPTSGYTRSMGIYNWRANTKSYRLELVRDMSDDTAYKDIFVQTSVLYVDEDESKNGKDKMFYYLGLIQNIPSFESLQWKLRLGYGQYLNSIDNKLSYLDARAELNYLF
ncbi:hypothetical protein JHD48_04465 [Sulfurimonas sp. SAG-AH-194-I05]|nr:hypothetical protein [Sulfurimonas sp. SAG-AH-194-I05]MDF1874983.1 hypothetical protein [Sulfurimonas sp. SAG-AH-194-I05]